VLIKFRNATVDVEPGDMVTTAFATSSFAIESARTKIGVIIKIEPRRYTTGEDIQLRVLSDHGLTVIWPAARWVYRVDPRSPNRPTWIAQEYSES
jgi:hypothetical protein